MAERFEHGHEPRAEEIALHQWFLTLQSQIEAASAENDEHELRRLQPLLDWARKRGSRRTCGSHAVADSRSRYPSPARHRR